VLAKLTELLFVESLRRYVEGLPQEQTGWPAGLKDPFVSRALSQAHEVVRPTRVDQCVAFVGGFEAAVRE
jgi:hypothetical protein